MPSYEIYTHHIAYRMRIENSKHLKTRNEQYGVYRLRPGGPGFKIGAIGSIIAFFSVIGLLVR